MTPPKRRRLPKLWPLFLLPFMALAWWQKQFIYDQIKLYNYEPSAEISQLASETTMTDSARRVFYVNHPELKERSTFTTFCPVGTEQTVVLGCYKGPQRGIFLLSVDNAELEGIEQVTAAHEMLHAVYDRLSTKERTRIDGLLQDYYDNQLSDQSIKKTIDGYRKTEPNDVVNEMHSILGTQVGNLPSELEEYYAKHFENRAAVVALYRSYEQAFSSRQEQIRNFDQQLTAQKSDIDSLEATVKQQSDDLQALKNSLDRQRRNGNIDSYNAGVDDYNAAVEAYNSNVRSLRSKIDTYNSLVEQRNAIAFEEQSLVEAISAPNVTER